MQKTEMDSGLGTQGRLYGTTKFSNSWASQGLSYWDRGNRNGTSKEQDQKKKKKHTGEWVLEGK